MAATFGLSYPITPDVNLALARFPEIAKIIQVPTIGRSELEVVRLLGNTQYPHLDRLLTFIDRELPGSGDIGSRAMKHRDPFQFRELLAELFIFAHLRYQLGTKVRPASFLKSNVGPEIEVAQADLMVKIEVYSPLDLMGYQLVTEHLPMLFKYLEVNRGFSVEIGIDAIANAEESVWYPYTIVDRTQIMTWLNVVGERASWFLGRAMVTPGDRIRLEGPGGATALSIRVGEIFADPDIREVVFRTGTRSTDARLLFECGTPEDTARSGWGQKLKTKMRERQAGPPAAGVLRLLVLNFAQAETAWPDFFAWPRIATRLDKMVRLIANELTAGLAYDVVFPARLDIDCQFGMPIWLDVSLEQRGGEFFKVAGMTRTVSSSVDEGGATAG
jgi:hypothetical protein